MSRFTVAISRRLLVATAVLALLLPLTGTAGAQSGFSLDPTIEHEVLAGGIITPTTFQVTPDGRVIVASREGQITVVQQDGTTSRAAHLPVDAYDRQGGQFDESACPRGDECPAGFNLAEGGIHGMLLSPDFMTTGEMYLYYTVVDSLGADINPPKHANARPHCDGPGCPSTGNDEGKFRLSRFTFDLDTDTLDPATEVPLFENPAEWFYCCHYGGDLEWKNDGTLLMTVGDDTSSDNSDAFSPHDQRPDYTWNSAALTSQNKADRRGKVLRLDVAELEAAAEAGIAFGAGFDDPRYDGLPGGDLDPNPWADDADADPYIYAMGFRSNYRFAYNTGTDHMYVGTVGPDARYPDPTRGPSAHEELETVPPGGGTNHGWPFCIADNIAYNEYDFENSEAGQPFDCTGMTPASIYYTYNPSPTSPYATIVPVPINTILGGTTYFRPDSGALRLPETYDSSVIWLEHGRSAVYRTPINDDGTLDTLPTSTVPVAHGNPGASFANTIVNPIDATVGPDGAVYLLEGNGFWNSTDGRVSRLKCAGCAPEAADYGGDVAVLPATDLAVAGLDGDAGQALPAWAVVLAALGLGGLVASRRRRQVV